MFNTGYQRKVLSGPDSTSGRLTGTSAAIDIRGHI